MSLTRSAPADSSSTADVPTVFVVDGDRSARETLDLLIRSAGWQSRTAASAEEFLARPRVMTPSCLVAEVRLPGLTGLDLQRRLSGRWELPIIFMSAHADIRSAVQAMKRGALEVLTKPLMTDELLGAIRSAIERSRAALSQLAKMRVLQERYASLTTRERQVMTLVVSGRLNKLVGEDLGISEITVKAHRRGMMRKMQAGSLAELVTMVGSLRNWSNDAAGYSLAPQSPDAHRQLLQSPHFRSSDAQPVSALV